MIGSTLEALAERFEVKLKLICSAILSTESTLVVEITIFIKVLS
jgi:hypothetical protein